MASSSPLPATSPIGRRVADYAFLVHSPETVANKMSPDVDNKPLARQRRRRTSKEDEDILKAEYLINSKPDKTARLEIVGKVALGEKEVQIWFQNKRQNDRRRSRPLEPSSSASLMSSYSTMSDPPTEDDTHVRETENAPEQQEQEVGGKSDGPKRVATPEATPDEKHDEDRSDSITDEPQATTESTTESPVSMVELPIDSPPADTALPEISNSQQTASSQGASQPRTSWISNRRSASFVRYNEDYASEVITFPNAPAKPAESPEVLQSTARSLKRMHSFVRISTNEDGTARIVTNLDKTPSPPHSKTKTNAATFSRAAAGMRRSYSAAGLNDRLVAAARGEPSPKMPKVSPNIGRSRDSRTWEFWCDPESRYNTSLTARAEQEESGSAADAIGLLRANRKILAQNQARQNTPLKSRHYSNEVLGTPRVKKSRGSVQRASTFSGRFSGKTKQKNGDETESDDMLQTESDKENWEPDVEKSARRQRYLETPSISQRARNVLGENTNVMSQTSSLGAMLAREKGKDRQGSSDPEQDDELRAFMSGGAMSGRTSLSSAEEAGCVEGLLKLSQGQWK